MSLLQLVTVEVSVTSVTLMPTFTARQDTEVIVPIVMTTGAGSTVRTVSLTIMWMPRPIDVLPVVVMKQVRVKGQMNIKYMKGHWKVKVIFLTRIKKTC